MTTTANASRYAPRGVQKDKPIPVRFYSAERTRFMEEAAKDGRSAAAFTRLMALKGFEQWEAEKRQAAQGAVN